MIVFKRIGVLLLAVIIYAFFLELGERFEIPGVHGFVSSAQANRRPPVNADDYAGVARRTARRCAAGVYYC